MIWTNKGLRKRVAELEAEVSSLNLQVKELKFSEKASIDLLDNQHLFITYLEKKLQRLTETSSNVAVPPEKEEKSSMSVGRRIAMNLRNGR